MFQQPFSFEGRIRRTEYGLSFLILVFARIIISLVVGSILIDANDPKGPMIVYYLLQLPVLFFFWAQGAKRCHDLNLSGWYQLIPFFPLYMIFAPGKEEENQYGVNPKLETINF
jgi:uncharacterized membrane protein YhaH (DUF805 family)